MGVVFHASAAVPWSAEPSRHAPLGPRDEGLSPEVGSPATRGLLACAERKAPAPHQSNANVRTTCAIRKEAAPAAAWHALTMWVSLST